MPADRGADRHRTNDTALPADDIIGRPGWMSRASCVGTDPALYATSAVMPEAERICNGCAVKIRCLSWAVQANVVGTWAGTTFDERKAMRHQLAAAHREEGVPLRRNRAIPGLGARRRR